MWPLLLREFCPSTYAVLFYRLRALSNINSFFEKFTFFYVNFVLYVTLKLHCCSRAHTSYNVCSSSFLFGPVTKMLSKYAIHPLMSAKHCSIFLWKSPVPDAIPSVSFVYLNSPLCIVIVRRSRDDPSTGICIYACSKSICENVTPVLIAANISSISGMGWRSITKWGLTVSLKLPQIPTAPFFFMTEIIGVAHRLHLSFRGGLT